MSTILEYGFPFSFGIILGLFFTYDLIIREKDKENNSFMKSIIYFLTIAVPALLPKVLEKFVDIDTKDTDIWFQLFYISIFITIIITFLTLYFTTYKKLVKTIKTANEIPISFLDFLFQGYGNFKDEIQTYIAKDAKTKRDYENNILATSTIIGNNLPQFISEMFVLFDETNHKTFSFYFIQQMINHFFGRDNGRFTLREYEVLLNQEKNQKEEFMVATICTNRDRMPGNIPLNTISLIKHSHKLKRPVLYSENKELHFKTENDSFGKSKYDEYVSYSLLEKDNKPFISLALDVKGDDNVTKLHALVKSQIFTIFCNILAAKISKELNNDQQ